MAAIGGEGRWRRVNETLILRLIAGIAIVVSAGWLVAVVLWPLWQPDFQPPMEITAVMTTTVTGLIGLYLKAKNPKNGGDDNND